MTFKDSKILRKQKRCQALVSKDSKIPHSDEPTKFLAICNAGLTTGLQEEVVLNEISKVCDIVNLVMIPNKSYCFFECKTNEDAELLFNHLHGTCGLGQNDAVIYLSYFESIPYQDSIVSKLRMPEGLVLFRDFISEEEEKIVLDSIKGGSYDSDGTLKHRSVKHFGYEFLYGMNNVDPQTPLENKIPGECDFLWTRLASKDVKDWHEPDQLTVNVYEPGQGIPPHVDTHSAFLDPLVSLSLESDIVMEFKKGNEKAEVLLPRRSLLLMTGESRYDWVHGITPRHTDIVLTSNKTLTSKARQRRTSLTFRKLRRAACNCKYPRLCDSQQTPKLAVVNLAEVATKLEQENVHTIYDKIANHFSETRHSPWPKVVDFLNSFDEGEILLDVGCGNGKYLNVNTNLLAIGCDRSHGLLKVCTSRQNSVFQCDCLSLPIRDNSVDGCISIAVIHHLATPDRRKQAVTEMARVLRTSGRCLIYVWAKDQKLDDKKSSYLRQNKAVNKNKRTENDLREETATSNEFVASNVNLPIHTNRTEFQNQDVLVPWKLKSQDATDDLKSVYLRYYHVFDENELDDICKSLGNLQVEHTYYDQGNHCVIFKKI